MESKAILPLPPGMVPSSSREDMTALDDLIDKEEETGKENNTILKEGNLGSTQRAASAGTGSGGGGGGGDGEEVDTTDSSIPAVQHVGGTHQHAWGSPPNEDQEEEAATAMSPEVAPMPLKMTSTASPFIATSTPYSQQAAVHKPQMDHITPKRVLSPLKRVNRVAPYSSGGVEALKLTSEEDAPLKSSSASLLDQKPREVREQRERPDSAPQKNGSRQQVPIDARVIVKSGGEEDGLYSTVVKKTGARPANKVGVKKVFADPKPFVPSLDAYEPEPLSDSSLIIANQATVRSSSSNSSNIAAAAAARPLNTSQVLENDYTMTPDPLYSTVEGEEGEGEEEVDASDVSTKVAQEVAATYDSALLKQLKKHDDKKGNVQLVSIKGTAAAGIAASATMSFPQNSSSNMTALHYAAANGDKKLLAEKIAALPVSQDTVEMVLGSEKLVKREGIDVLDSEGRSPLMHAVHNNHLQAVKTLAENGANVNAIAADGSTTLHQAAFTGTIEMVALLLSLGADGMARDYEARTPLHWSTKNHDPKCTEFLLDKVSELDVDVRDGALMTALMWAAFHGRTEQVRVLLEKKADPAAQDMDGMTAVHWSIQRHDTRVLQMLINLASVQYVDKKGKTMMHQAAEQGSAKAVSLIKAVRPVSVNDLDENGRTPLHWATVCENPDAIRALLHHGSNPNIQDFSGKTALDYATQKGMHYCGLILTKAELDEDNYRSFLTYGSASGTAGARALNFQDGGQPTGGDQLEEHLTKEQLLQVQTVCVGSWVYKFTNSGKGPLHPRYFWVNPSNLKMCWAKSKDASDKNTKSDMLVGARSSASPIIYGRKDFDPIDKHKYAFTIFTSNRVLDVVAVSSEDYKLWLNGLQLVLHLGSVNVTKLMSKLHNASGELKPIP